MRIERLRGPWSDEKLNEIYATPHNHTQWEDHHLRVNATIKVADWLMRNEERYTVADLSTGNAAIPLGLRNCNPGLFLGDYAHSDFYGYKGPIEETIQQIPMVDLFICSETLEHVDDPTAVLAAIRIKSRHLVLSTPIDEPVEVGNEQHYWGWDVEGIHHLLEKSGWDPVVRNDVIFYEPHFTYNFQIWGCR